MSAPIGFHAAVTNLLDIPGRGVVFAAGDTVPSDGTADYATGCLFLHLDGSAGFCLYCNEGTATSCDFDIVLVL